MLVAGGAASAGAAWDGPLTLDHPVAAAAGNAQGEEAFIWQVREPGKIKLGLSRLRGSYAEAQLRLPGGQLTSAQAVSPTSGHVVRSLAIGVDGTGTVTAAWIDAMRFAVMVAVRPLGGRFGSPVEVSNAAYIGEKITLVVAPDGAAGIIRSTMAQITLVQRPAGPCARSNSRGCFGPTRVIRSPATSQGFTGPFSPSDASFGPHDRLYITWPNHLAIASGRRMGPTLAVPTGQLQALTVLPNGSAVLAWIGTTNADDMTVRTAVVDRTGRRLTAPTVVSSPWSPAATGACSDLALQANPQGETTLVWECQPLVSGSPTTALAASIRPNGGTFAPARAISAPGTDATHPVLAVDARGNAILAYSSNDTTVVAQVRPPGKDFAGPVAIGTGQPSFTLAAANGVTLAWPGPLRNTTTVTDWTP